MNPIGLWRQQEHLLWGIVLALEMHRPTSEVGALTSAVLESTSEVHDMDFKGPNGGVQKFFWLTSVVNLGG